MLAAHFCLLRETEADVNHLGAMASQVFNSSIFLLSILQY